MYLISVVETYRADTESEAMEAIEEARKDDRFTLYKHNVLKKEVKQKGEVVDEYYKVTLTKVFDDIKEPYHNVKIEYEV